MSDPSVSERRIRPIQDAIAAGNWKQALQLCEKWQKKGEKSDRFLALKASVLVNQADDAHYQKGKAETLQLCRRTAAVTDIEAIYQLQASLKRLSLDREESPKLWERATTALPNDKEFLTTWLNGSLSESNWLMAQKAAMALRKAFPKERQHEFLNILLCYLIHRDDRLSEKDRMLFGTLAYRMITKASEIVPVDKTQVLAPGKAISTTEELALLTRVFVSTGHEAEAIDVLQSTKLGLKSVVAEQDPQMVFSLLIEALDASKEHDVVFEICQKLLTNEDGQGHAEDDRVWRTMVRTAKCGSPNMQQACMESIETVLRRQPRCRAAHVAKLDLLMTMVEDCTDQESDLFVACQKYLEFFQSKPFCFGDVVAALKTCGTGSVKGIIQTADADSASEALQVLYLKLDYSTLSEKGSSKVDFLKFATKAIQVHKRLSKDKTECPEAVLLAALALIRLASMSHEMAYALQANNILEYSAVEFAEYYPSGVRLLQTHRILGLESLAMDRFGRLSVKNIQWETVGHLILTRISSMHPLPCYSGESNSFNPLGALDAGLNMLSNAESSLDQCIKKGLEYGSYSNVLDSVEVKHNIEFSLNRRIFEVEERMIQALVGMPVDSMLEDRPKVLVDKRDFAFLETYDVHDGLLEVFLQCGPSPRSSWLDAMTFQDHLTMTLQSELAGRSVEAQRASAAFSLLMDTNTRTDEHKASELTDAEISSDLCHRTVAKIVTAYSEPLKIKQEEIDLYLRSLLSWLEENSFDGVLQINGIRVPSWKYLHLCFTRLQAIQTVALLVAFMSRKNKSKANKGFTISKEKIGELQKAVGRAEETIHRWTKDLKAGINAPGVLGKLVDTASGRIQQGDIADDQEYHLLSAEFADICDEVALEEYCGRMKDSWEDALDGIMAIKIKMPK